MPWSANSNDDPSGLGRYLQRQHERLAAREAQVQAQLSAQYQATAQQIAPHVRAWADAYSHELARVRAATGDPAAQVSEAWIREHLDGTLGQKLTRFVQAEVNRFADAAQADVTDAASDALAYGGQDAAALVTQALSPIAGALAGKGMTPGDLVNTVQGDALVGLESNWLSEAGDERLANIWFQYGDQASQALYQLLHGAIRSGDNPNAVAPEIRNLLAAAGFQPDMEAISMSRALTAAWAGQMGRYLSQARSIARTEMLGAYRSAQVANYRANADVVKGWYWSAAIGACPVCCDLDGTFFPLDTAMDDCHINCRCSPQPATSSWADILGPLGIDASNIPETSFEPQLGSDWFAEQGTDYQRSILGPAAFNAYQAGALRLDDLVGRTADGQYYQKSMKSLGLDANAWLGKGPNAGVPVEIAVPGGGVTYVMPGPQVEEEPIFNMAGRTEEWAGVDAALAGLRGADTAAAQQALDDAQSRVDALRQQWQDAIAANPAAPAARLLPSDTESALWDVAKARAALNAAQGGSGAIIFANSYSDPFAAREALDAFTAQAFGHTLTQDELAGLVGAPNDAYLTIYGAERGNGLTINLHGPSYDPLHAGFQFTEYDADRYLLSDGRGGWTMTNASFGVRSDLQGSGIGAQIFSAQAQQLSDLDVRYIETNAAGAGNMGDLSSEPDANGYYTWPRFGYLGHLPQEALDRIQEAIANGDVPAAWGSYTTIQQLMRTPTGRDWWKTYGSELDGLRFDLKPNSLSMRILRAYLKEKGVAD